ncbi:MAG: hypothetical protein AAB350_00085 [Patescibacteria group bacterium]
MQDDKKIEEYIEEEDFENKGGRGWKGKFIDFIGGKYFVPITIVLVAIIAFSLGRISGLQEKREPVRVLNNTVSVENPTSNVGQTAAVGASNASGGSVVASKNGTKYHYPWCAGAKQISAKNLVTFDSIEKARTAGYTPASNCKGLK